MGDSLGSEVAPPPTPQTKKGPLESMYEKIICSINDAAYYINLDTV